MACLSSP